MPLYIDRTYLTMFDCVPCLLKRKAKSKVKFLTKLSMVADFEAESNTDVRFSVYIRSPKMMCFLAIFLKEFVTRVWILEALGEKLLLVSCEDCLGVIMLAEAAISTGAQSILLWTPGLLKSTFLVNITAFP